MRLSANCTILKALGLLLLAAAVLKGHELLTTPMANADIWTNRNFMIFQVEFELALGIWLLSGVFKRAAWLATLGCFVLFCSVTFYKALSGFGSCGCFGNLHINPWITLFAVDLPAVVLLLIFRPKLEIQKVLHVPHWLEPLPKRSELRLKFLIGLIVIGGSSPMLILNEPAMATTQYEVLEPETWIGKELPILENIDIAEKLKAGNWLVVLYHHDCPACAEAIPKLDQMARDWEGNEEFMQIALIEVPPYSQSSLESVSKNAHCVAGKLDQSKEWFVTTPAIMLTQNNNVLRYWEENIPVSEQISSTAATSHLIFSSDFSEDNMGEVMPVKF